MTSSPKTTISNSPNFSRRVKISLMAFERAFLSMAQTPTRILREEMGIVDVRRARRGAWKCRVYRCAANDARARPEASPASPRTSGTRALSSPRRFEGDSSTPKTANLAASAGFRRDASPARRGSSRVASDATHPAPKRSPRAAGLARAAVYGTGLGKDTRKKNLFPFSEPARGAHLVEAKDESQTKVASSLSTRNYETVGDRCASSETLFSRRF